MWGKYLQEGNVEYKPLYELVHRWFATNINHFSIDPGTFHSFLGRPFTRGETEAMSSELLFRDSGMLWWLLLDFNVNLWYLRAMAGTGGGGRERERVKVNGSQS